ncbi:MAG: spore coat protein U domain-containing protein [Alphaproteobacteria bacterium]|nr:spore coat protein U domain-containing protein [Alphaproteobacteria bacterium]MBV9371499.1 spore coat protein U domain-containing protein [Alphaproteobacteria bacterium]MBV9902759.1 spore coat protein U domain-containing protein [Alphaproteobacteria bacterium]
MKNIVRCGVAAAIAAAFGASPAFAADVGSSLGVNATVSANCTVSTSPVAFNDVDVTSGQAVQGTGSVSVTCTNGTAWAALADAGAGTGADLASRKMANGANLLSYSLFTDSARTQLWGDGIEGATATFSDTGTGSVQTKTVYGLIPAGQTGVPAGDYADTVQVTVSY